MAGLLLGDFGQIDLEAHFRIDLDRLDETHAVEAVIDHHLQAFRQDEDVFHQFRDQRQRQETVGNGAAKWRLRGFDRVDVNELIITGGFGEQVDAFLIDGEPFGTSEFLADIIFELCNWNIGH
ncbi:hypothetical protein D3C84_661340 [compost metagenome]